MPYFPTQDDLYSIIQRESPDGLYPQGAPTDFAFTADDSASAKIFSDLYSVQESIYDNYFPQTADDRIPDWEYLVFGFNLDSSLTDQERIDRILAKIRTRRRTTPGDILNTVYTIIDSSIAVEIVGWSSDEGRWVLDFSQLDINTALSAENGMIFGLRSDWCSVTAAELGITDDDYTNYRQECYTYDVRIYSYTLTTAQRAALDSALRDAEPARSAHVILDGLDPANMISGDT